MNVLIAASEAVPYVKTGGLADVTGSLLKELRRRKEKAFLLLPLYETIKRSHEIFGTGKSISVRIGPVTYRGTIFASGKKEQPEAYFIECDELYGRPELYGTSSGDYPDNATRFIFFSRAVLEVCLALRLKPDVIHCNDWQTALVPLYLKNLYKDHAWFAGTSTLFTIHNLGYQGIFDPSALLLAGLGREYFVPERLEFYGKINLMKAGLLYADIINTVSITYSREILQREFGFGLDGVLKKRARDLSGIINGIDYEEWDPEKDPLVPFRYGAGDMKGKAQCKKALVKEAGFADGTLPVVALISRLSEQKGIDLVLRGLESLLALGVNLAVLGKGDNKFETMFQKAAGLYKGKMYVHIGFGERLARLLYAGSDFFLMPSLYEPCGLGQLIAMKYGTVPIARKTGGLADTIRDYDHMSHTGTGFLFSDYSPYAMQDAVKRAICVFAGVKHRLKMAREVMGNDFSWSGSTDRYLALYRTALRRVGR